MAWKKSFSHISETFSCIRSQFLWYNNSIKIGNTPYHFKELFGKNANYINQLFKDNEELKHCKDFKREFYLSEYLLHKWLQLTHVVPRKWRHILKQNLDISQNLIYLNHHLIKNNRLEN